MAFLFAGCARLGVSDPVPQRPSATLQAGQVIGGGTRQITAGVHPVGDFLPHPELLAPSGSGEAALAYLNPNVNMASYRKVLLDQVAVAAAANSQLTNVPADQRAALANTLYADLYDALREKCEMVQAASPQALHLRFALVDATEPNAAINTVATYAPYASSAYSAASFLFNKGVGYFAGTATAEGFATDAVDGTLLWEVVDKRGGTAAFVADTLDNWRDVHHVFEAWGILLRARLRQMGVCRQ